MAFPHVYHAFRKLNQEFGKEFEGTALHSRMWGILHPTPAEIRMRLRSTGQCAFMYSDLPLRKTSVARDRLYRAAKSAGMKVSTSKKNGWVVAECVDVAIKMKMH